MMPHSLHGTGKRNMDKQLLRRIKELYNSGTNIMEYVRAEEGSNVNSDFGIELAYELQAGSYTESYDNNEEMYLTYTEQLTDTMREYMDADKSQYSLLEVGVGEATTFKTVIQQLETKHNSCFGFDISLSRFFAAKKFLNRYGLQEANMFVGNLFEIPFADNSIDVVYSNHSIEPNRGREEDALRELYRIAKRYIFLFEPSYHFASPEGRSRMDRLGYIHDLYDVAIRLGYRVLDYRRLDIVHNPLNPTAVLVIEKDCEHAFMGGGC
jgi:hypothetical protein